MAGGRRAYPVPFHVEFYGTSESQEWAGEVQARSKLVAIVIAAAQAAREGVLFTPDTQIEAEPVTPG